MSLGIVSLHEVLSPLRNRSILRSVPNWHRASAPGEPVQARKVISATGTATSIKQRYRRSSTARPCRQIMRQLLDRIAEALIARNIEQIVDDLFQGLLVNMPAQRLRDLAHSGIR